jgi:uncharacterized repeat protein (TIGR01451 family)
MNVGGDVYVRDMATGDTTLVSRRSGTTGPALTGINPALSHDGRYVAFDSQGFEESPGVDAVYVRDTQSNTTSLVSADGAGNPGDAGSNDASISADGRYVAFTSAGTNLSADDGVFVDVFVRDTVAGTTTLVSRRTGSGADDPADGASYRPSISGDGRYVGFDSLAGNLGGPSQSVYVRDLQTDTTILVSGAAADGASWAPSLSDPPSSGGRLRVAFQSMATNLVPGGTEGMSHVYLRDLEGQSTTLVSTAVDGAHADARSDWPAISGNGRYVAFDSEAGNLHPAAADVTNAFRARIPFDGPPEPEADLSVAKTDAPDPVRVGDALTYTLAVTNAGPSAATGVVLTDMLPDGVRLDSVTAAQGSCDPSAGQVACDLGSLAAGSGTHVTIVVTPMAAGTLTNSALVEGNEDDPDPADNEATEQTTVEPRLCPAELGFGETIECSIQAPGEVDELRFTVASAPTRVLVRMTSDAGSPVDPRVRVLGATAPCASSRGTPGTVEVQCTIGAPGTHTIAVEDADRNETGGYWLHLQRLSNPLGAANCTTLRYGDTPPGSIDARAETDCFDVTVTVPVTVLVRMTTEPGAPIDPQARVFTPAGGALPLCATSRGGPGTIEIQCSLTAPGTHSIIVNDVNSDETGGYDVHLQRLSNPGVAPNCTPIDVADTLPGSIDERAGTDCFTHTTVAPTTVLLRLTTAPGSPVDPQARMFAPSGAPLAACASSRGGPGTIEIQCSLTLPGTHTIIVNDVNGDEAGAYDLHLQRLDNPPTAANCTAIGIADTLPGAIGARAETACFTHTTAVAARVLLRLTTAPGSPIDPQARVFTPGGAPLPPCASSRGAPGTIEIQCSLTAAGTYTIVVNDVNSDETGGYDLHLQRLDNPPGAANCTVIVFPETLPGSIDARAETDCFTHTAAVPTRVLIRLTTALGSPVDPQARVFTPGGDPLAACASSRGAPGTIEIRCPLTAAGTHTIVVNDVNSDETGGYDLHLQRLDNPPGAANCITIGPGDPLTGSVGSRAETDCFDLTVPAPTAVVIRITSVAPVDPQGRVFGPAGDALPLCASSRGGPGTIVVSCTLPAAGTHSIIVNDVNSDEIGGYTVRVE